MPSFVAAPDDRSAGTASVASRWRDALDGARRFLFGHDVFISYARADALEYAQAIADALTRQHIAAYVDQLGTPPGPQMPPLLLLRLRLSSMLVLIASPAAAESAAVAREVEEFTRRNHRLFVVDVDGALDGVQWYRGRIKGGPARRVSAAALAAGAPSDTVVQQILKNVDFARREDRLRKTLRYTLAAIGTVLLLGAGGVLFATAQARNAQQTAAAATRSQRVAEQNAERQQALTKVALLEADEAQRTADDAQSMRAAAQASAFTALARARDARDTVEARRRTARALHLANLASSAYDESGDGLVSSLLIAVESLREDWTVEGTAASLRAMAILPPRLARVWAHAGPVTALALSADGQLLASGGNGRVRLWRVTTRGRAVTLTPAPDPEVPPDRRRHVASLAFSPDGGLLAAGAEKSLVVWKLEALRPVFQHSVDLTETAHGVAFSPDGRTLAVAETNRLRLLETTGWRDTVLELTEQDHALDVTFSPDGRWLAVGGATSVQLWDARARVLRAARPGSHQPLTFSADGRWLIAGDDVIAIAVDSAGDLNLPDATAPAPSLPRSVAVSATGQYLLTAGTGRSMSIRELRTGREAARIPVDAQPGLIGVRNLFSPTEGWIASGTETGAVTVWQGTPHNESVLLRGDGPVADVAFSPDGRWMAMVGSGLLRVLETGTWREAVRLPGFGHSLAFTADGRWLIGFGRDGVQPVWVRNWRPTPRLRFERQLRELWISPDGTRLAVRSQDDCRRYDTSPAELRVWDIDAGFEIGWREEPGCRARTSASRPLAARGQPGLWEQTRNWVRVGGDPDAARGGWRVRSDSAVALIDARTGRTVARLQTAQEVVARADVSPDGRWLATAGNDGTLRLWRLGPADAMIAEACARLPRNLTREEWERAFPGQPYRATCPGLPIPPPRSTP